MTRSLNHCSRRKAISNYYFECVSLALVIQHAMCMFRIILSQWSVWLYLTISYAAQFSKKVTNIKNILTFC